MEVSGVSIVEVRGGGNEESSIIRSEGVCGEVSGVFVGEEGLKGHTWGCPLGVKV